MDATENELKLSLLIRKIRNSLGFSQGYVSKKLKVTQQAYSHMENYPCKVSIERLTEICEVLQIDLLSLLIEWHGGGKTYQGKLSRKKKIKQVQAPMDDIASSINDIHKKLDDLLGQNN